MHIRLPFVGSKDYKDPARESKTPLGAGSELDKGVGKQLLKIGPVPWAERTMLHRGRFSIRHSKAQSNQVNTCNCPQVIHRIPLPFGTLFTTSVPSCDLRCLDQHACA